MLDLVLNGGPVTLRSISLSLPLSKTISEGSLFSSSLSSLPKRAKRLVKIVRSRQVLCNVCSVSQNQKRKGKKGTKMRINRNQQPSTRRVRILILLVRRDFGLLRQDELLPHDPLPAVLDLEGANKQREVSERVGRVREGREEMARTSSTTVSK